MISLACEGKHLNAIIYVDKCKHSLVLPNQGPVLHVLYTFTRLDLEETVVFLQSTVSGLQTTIDDLYVTENLQNQGLIDLNENLVQAETEIANVEYDLNTLQSNLNGDYPHEIYL